MHRYVCLVMSIFIFSLLLSACAAPTPQYTIDLSVFFPDLSDPPGAFRSRGGAGEKGFMSFSLVTELPIEEVSQHYAD